MFPTDYQNGFFIYVAAWLVFLTILWYREQWRTKINAWSLSEGKLCVCGECHFAFLLKPRELAARCPRCNGLCYITKGKRRR